MDLNTATYSELVTLLNIGEVRAASIVMVRESLERIGRNLTLLDLTLDCGIPGDVVKDLTVNGDIQPIPQHEDSCKSDQTSTLLVSIAASIQAMKMNDCDDNEVKVCKLVEALRGKSLDYFESLLKELRLEFDSLCSMFEGRFGRQEAPATMRSKLKCITQRVEESLAEFGERALKVASEGYVGMTGQWVQVGTPVSQALQPKWCLF